MKPYTFDELSEEAKEKGLKFINQVRDWNSTHQPQNHPSDFCVSKVYKPSKGLKLNFDFFFKFCQYIKSKVYKPSKGLKRKFLPICFLARFPQSKVYKPSKGLKPFLFL